jgi:class 3 adenylate cyclase/tetratricopeptide (TPR) repeat protein
VSWLETSPDEQIRSIDGSLAFVDISGFTKLTERLARRGRVGAEEMSDILDSTFGTLLSVARRDGAELVKWGGDAILLIFDGPDHAARAARSAFRMRKTLREISRRPTSAGAISLRMSVGIHSAVHHFFLVGDPAIHRELIVSGPAASVTAEMEAAASAGQIVVSAETAKQLPARLVGAPVGEGRLLRGEPDLADLPVRPRTASRADVGVLVPPGIRDYVVSGTGEAEHRPIAVAFVQFSGTDAVLRAGGPPALAAALDECVRNVQHATAAHRVTFFESDINRDGGKIMLTAGAPRSAGADEDRMLRTARQIVDNAGTLPVRVGINRGYVFAGEFGPDFRRTYSVKGDAINLAARVMGKAAPGEVLATAATMSRARTRFDVEALPPFMVKGKAKPVDAVRLGAVRGELDAGPNEGPFVGRTDALERLGAAVDGARTGSGSFVDIVGGPGIGKSRLVDELRAARTDDIEVVVGRGDPYESNTAYLPVRGLLHQALAARFGADLPVGEQLRLLGADAPHLAPWLPLLGVALDAAVEDTTETRELAEQTRKAKLEETIVAAFTALLPAPTLLVFEDAHLMDEASGDLLRRVEDVAAERPWVVVVTRRDEQTGYRPAGAAAGYARLDLAPLDATAAVELVAAVTRGSPLTRPAMRALADRAGGNPLFIGSLATLARRSGSVADLPESIEGVVTSEIDRLDPQERSVLRYAAVLGMRFAEADLLDLLSGRQFGKDTAGGREGTIARRLGEFLDSDGDGTLHFRHALVRDVAYAGLPFRLRREMHERVGTALEARAGAAGDAVRDVTGDVVGDVVGDTAADTAGADAESELLSLHFFHAGVYAKAWSYSRLAGERANAHYAYAEAGDFFERAIESARRHGGTSQADLAAVYTRLGDVRAMAGAPRQAIDAYRHARRYLADATAGAELMHKEAILWQRVGKYTQSLAMLTHGLRRLDGLPGPAPATVRGKITTHYGFTRYLQGRSRDAVRWCRIGVEEAARGSDRRALAMAYNALELAYLHSPLEPDRPYGELAMQIYEELEDLPGQGHSANTLAIAAHNAGRWADAERLFAHAAELFGRIGDITNESNAIYTRADMLLKQGRFAEAEAPLNDVIETARAVDDQELVSLAVRELARAYSGMGRHAAAAELFQSADARFAELGLRHEQAALRAAGAEAALRAGNPDGALTLVADAEQLAREVGNTEVVPWLHRMRARALLDLGALEQASLAVERGLAATGAAENGYDRALLQLVQARVAELTGAEVGPLRDEATEVLRALGVDPALTETVR